ncbi:hypothetical protein BHE74_00035446 [Ensete ventricosum]|nr:hypothetical protein GW17_00027694 [Ensete ventricosum]RWW57741.1 hypothetical protein BHE74_00035446 [Ensete ventricosum]RZR94757.1 hypothetical protein BHM03_00023511 [Ensete ventricosum]
MREHTSTPKARSDSYNIKPPPLLPGHHRSTGKTLTAWAGSASSCGDHGSMVVSSARGGRLSTLHRKEPGCVVGEQRQGREGLWGLDEEEEEEEEEVEFLESMEGGLVVDLGASMASGKKPKYGRLALLAKQFYACNLLSTLVEPPCFGDSP